MMNYSFQKNKCKFMNTCDNRVSRNIWIMRKLEHLLVAYLIKSTACAGGWRQSCVFMHLAY